MEGGASDVHLKVGNPVVFRIDGNLVDIESPLPTVEWVETILQNIIPEHLKEVLQSEREIDFSYYLEGVGRFRTNCFQQRGTFALAMRYVKTDIPEFEELGLIPVLKTIAEAPRGIVLVSGTTGSGKSTTLAAMLQHINKSSRKHIVTLEDPIEFVFSDDKSVIEQREIGLDSKSFAAGLKHVLRQDPDVIMIGVPDMKQAAVYESEIEPNLSKGKTLLFTHGFAIHFELIKPPRGVSVIMVAPKGPGHIVRSQYKEGKGVPALIAVLKGSARTSKDIALAWAAGIGAARSGVLQTSFKEETETDLFGEQTVLCGGASALVQAGFEVLVEAGYQPEMAYFECLHELKLIVDLMNESGISGMRFSISETAKWGDVSVGPKIVDASVKRRMKTALKEIQNGKFAKGWIKEYETGYKQYNKLLKAGEKHGIEKVGARLRGMMPWMKKRRMGGSQASY